MYCKLANPTLPKLNNSAFTPVDEFRNKDMLGSVDEDANPPPKKSSSALGLSWSRISELVRKLGTRCGFWGMVKHDGQY